MKLSEKSRKLMRVIYSSLGVAAATLLFPACEYGMVAMYGMPPAPEYGPPYAREDLLIRGFVKSKKTGKAIPGIGIWIKDITVYSAILTDLDGNFYIYVPKQDKYTIIFTDIDGGENGGSFRQRTFNLTKTECEALAESPLIVELES